MKTLTITPGSSAELRLASPASILFFMTDDDDVLWVTRASGPLNVEHAVRLDKSQCPCGWVAAAGSLYLHSPAQGGRTIQVSVVIGGGA